MHIILLKGRNKIGFRKQDKLPIIIHMIVRINISSLSDQNEIGILAEAIGLGIDCIYHQHGVQDKYSLNLFIPINPMGKYGKDMLLLSRLYYEKIFRPIHSIFMGGSYNCSIEIPVLSYYINKEQLKYTLPADYSIEIKRSIIKSNTFETATISSNGGLVSILSNFYNALLLFAGFVNPHMVRHEMVKNEVDVLKAKNLLDMGCGSGRFLFHLAHELNSTRFIGIEKDQELFLKAKSNFQKTPEQISSRVEFVNSSILTIDNSYSFMDTITLIEVIEHLHQDEIEILFDLIFTKIKPEHLIITTPNKDYNQYLTMRANGLRHDDHKFEYTRNVFLKFLNQMSKKYQSQFCLYPIGWVKDANLSISFMAVFSISCNDTAEPYKSLVKSSIR